MIEIIDLLLIAVIMLGGGLCQGATGFGFGLVSLPLLVGILPLPEASIAVTFGSLWVTLTGLWKLREHFSWDRLKPFTVSLFAMIPVGAFTLYAAPKSWLMIMVGGVLLAAAVQSLWRTLRPSQEERHWHSLFAGIPLGMLAGWLGGAFGTSGPAAVAYVSSQGFSRHRFTASLQMIFAGGALARLLILGLNGRLAWHLALAGTCGGIAALIGMRIGLYLLNKISERIFKRIVIAMLFLLAAKFFWTGGRELLGGL